MLSDNAIRKELAAGRIVIDPPPADERIQPVSIDLTLGDSYRAYVRYREEVRLGEAPRGLSPGYTISDLVEGGLVLAPQDFVLLTTAETVTLPGDVVGMVHGKSTIGRLGLMVHVTAGLIDPGFSGQITLEAYNVGDLELELHPGDRIAQLTFEYASSPCDRPYGSHGLGSHYQHQSGATGPRGCS